MKKVGVFTGSRAEFDLLSPVLCELRRRRKEFELQIFVSGAHLDSEFGSTVKLIRQQGFQVVEEIVVDHRVDSLMDTALSIGKGIVGFAKALHMWSPELLIIYGDRFEGFAAVVAATQMGIPVAHIEGGDITEGGALDDSIRHAMTKLSHLHFTTNERAKTNIIAMGEEPWRVMNVGLPSLDRILQENLASREEIASHFRVDLDKPLVVFTQHSVATEFDQVLEQLTPTLKAIETLATEGVQFIMTYPNNDAGGLQILHALKEFDKRTGPEVQLVAAMGGYYYFGILALSKSFECRLACLGNSSSGIKETPYFCCPTINIGTRQSGRLRGDNVLDVSYDRDEILTALRKGLFDEVFRQRAAQTRNPYGEGKASKQICDLILGFDLGKSLLQKKHVFNNSRSVVRSGL